MALSDKAAEIRGQIAAGLTNAGPAAAAWHARHAVLARWLQAGPAALVLSVLTMAALPLLLPQGAAGIDHLVLPVVLFPLIWAALVVIPVAAERPSRVSLWFFLLAAADFAAILLSFAV
jgi:hypothetical protein